MSINTCTALHFVQRTHTSVALFETSEHLIIIPGTYDKQANCNEITMTLSYNIQVCMHIL